MSQFEPTATQERDGGGDLQLTTGTAAVMDRVSSTRFAKQRTYFGNGKKQNVQVESMCYICFYISLHVKMNVNQVM